MGAAASTLEIPDRIGPYRILDVIGQGGMGVVFRAEHEATERRVALKTVRASDEYQVRGLRREIHALQRLDHPGVVRITDQGLADGIPWYAMELLVGETLASYNSRLWRGVSRTTSEVLATRADRGRGDSSDAGPDTSPDAAVPTRVDLGAAEVAGGHLPFAITVMHRLCSTLGYVHGEGVVHRDLKAANVLLCEGDAPKLLDFGLVWRFPAGTSREVLDEVSGGIAGTAGYMSPEQIRGEMVDARADLYSLGCLLYELLTGRLPFDAGSATEIRKSHLTTQPLPPSLLVERVPPELEALVMRLLAKRAQDRFGHADEVARVLASLGAKENPWEGCARARSYLYRPAIVGRTEPLDLVDDGVRRAIRMQGGLIVLSGESGIGKTYLAMSAAREAQTRSVDVVTAGCTAPSEGGHPNDALLHPFRPLLLAIADRCLDSPDLTHVLLGDRARVLAACEPSLALLPSISEYPIPDDLPAQAAQQRLLAALGETIAAFALVRPFVLVLDDLQWADELSLVFLASLPDDWFDEKGLLVLATVRAEDETDAIGALMARPYTRRISLGRLPEESIGELVCGMLAIDTPPVGFVELMAREAGGNPFFVAEYLRTAVAERLLSRTPQGGWELDRRLLGKDPQHHALALPKSIAALVARRLSGLTDAGRQLASVAAVLGRDVDRDLLLALSSLSDEALLEPLRELVARQVLEEGPRGQLRFLHDKVRDAAYAEVPLADRRELHRRAAEAIELALAGSPELPLAYATLAHHHRRAEQLPRAVDYLERAGDHALASYANREALAHFGEAVALDARASGHDRSPSSALRRARWERKLAEAHYALGDLEAVDGHVARALSLTGHAPPTSNLGWVRSLLRDIPTQILHRTRPRPAASADPVTRELLAEAATAMHHLAERSYYRFDALPMVAASLKSVNLAEQAGIDVRVAAPYGMLGMTVGISKLHGLGHHYFDLARKAASATGDDAGMAFCLYAKAAWRIGDAAWDEVRILCDEGAAIARRIRDVKSLGMAQTLTAHADFYTGRFRESARIYRALAETARRNGDRQHLSWGLYAEARAQIALGDLDGAEAMLLESSEILEPLVEVPSKIIAPGLLASVYVRTGDLERAIEAADLTTSRIRKNLPTVFATVAGYAGASEAYLARWESYTKSGSAAETAVARKMAKRAVFDLMTLAMNIPIGWPYYHRLKGQEQILDQNLSAARKSFQKGLASASRLGMKYDEALAHFDLARVEGSDTAARREHLSRAHESFEAMSCRFDLARLERLRSTPA